MLQTFRLSPQLGSILQANSTVSETSIPRLPRHLTTIRSFMVAEAKDDIARVEAEKLDLRAAEAQANYRTQIQAAKSDAVAIRDEKKSAAEAVAREAIAAVRSEAEKSLETGRSVLADSEAKNRADVDAQVETLAVLIADSLMDTGGKA